MFSYKLLSNQFSMNTAILGHFNVSVNLQKKYITLFLIVWLWIYNRNIIFGSLKQMKQTKIIEV